MNAILKFKFEITQEKSNCILSQNYIDALKYRDIEKRINNYDIYDYKKWYIFTQEYKYHFITEKIKNLIDKLEIEVIKKIRTQKIREICSKSETK